MNFFELLRIALLALAVPVLIAVSITDIRERRIPNKIMFPAIITAFICALALPERWMLLLGGLIGLVMLLIPTIIYGLAKAGGGDIKLALFLGLVLGYPLIIPALLIAFLSAGLFAAIGIVTVRMTRHATLAFGPFLALGGIVAAVGGYLLQWGVL
ncbi:MAG: prepilin peptidase [Roseiflexaceae bacterium]|nr:prepilin peptidase [Roseiflexaceae bacterium]